MITPRTKYVLLMHIDFIVVVDIFCLENIRDTQAINSD